jgi:hypothetical protein
MAIIFLAQLLEIVRRKFRKFQMIIWLVYVKQYETELLLILVLALILFLFYLLEYNYAYKSCKIFHKDLPS